MKDMEIKKTGNSRLLKSAIKAGCTWEEALEKLRDGTFPVDLLGVQDEGVNVKGTVLNKDNLLSDETAEALGLTGDDPTVNEALAAIQEVIRVVPIAHGGTGNAEGYIRTGLLSGTAAGTAATAEGSGTVAATASAHAEGKETIAAYPGKLLSTASFDSDSKTLTFDTDTADFETAFASLKAGTKLRVLFGDLTYDEEDYSITLTPYYDYTVASVDSSTYSVTVEEDVGTGQYNNLYGRYVVILDEAASTEPAGAHAEGYATLAAGVGSHAEGDTTAAYGGASHAEGTWTIASAMYAHAEGYQTEASGEGSHAEGNYSAAEGDYSHAEGSSYASGYASHAEGNNTEATSYWAHAEGYYSAASGKGSHAEGNNSAASGVESHAEGHNTEASGGISHAEGYNSAASGDESHAEGCNTKASGESSHAEGYRTTASSDYSHAEGYSTTASSIAAHAEGYYTIADNYASHAGGKYNKAMTTGGTYNNTTGDAFVIGNGTGSSAKSNAFRVTYAGAVYALSAFNSSGADYAEFFEWADGNADAEDRVGYFVTLSGKQIAIAGAEDYILGIVSAQPCIIGNSDEDWQGRWVHDEFGRFVKETVETPVTKTEVKNVPVLDDDGKETGKYTREVSEIETGETITGWRYQANPDYDPSQAYVERRDRPEWDCIGMLGVLAVRDDGSCEVDGFCKAAEGGIATAAEYTYGKTWRVLERVSENVVRVVFR